MFVSIKLRFHLHMKPQLHWETKLTCRLPSSSHRAKNKQEKQALRKIEQSLLVFFALNVRIVPLRERITVFNQLIQHVESIHVQCGYAGKLAGGPQLSGREFTIIKQLSHINSPNRQRQCRVCAISHSIQAHCGNSSSIFNSLATTSSHSERGLDWSSKETLASH